MATPNDQPLYLGRFRAGDELVLAVKAVSVDGGVSGLSAAPIASVYRDDGTLVARYALPGFEAEGGAAMHRRVVRVAASWAIFSKSNNQIPSGCVVHYQWPDISDPDVYCGLVAYLVVLPGGADSGRVTGLRLARRPQAAYLVRATADDALAKGKNPR